ncbi:STAS domain-containing protein [Cellulomonas sp. GbtcB1]|uniref:STAS domain-containing protein n=1 Tax=Cellulomonas sp. GbtcB1 TaxID=2824746 RepID=UPI001C3119F6|nr:STAS domain-containing protein [Cellulomonas sp. GbtcB1]
MSSTGHAPATIWVADGDPCVLHLAGALDAGDLARAAADLGVGELAVARALVARGVGLVDLSGATFIDSSVLRMVLAIGLLLRPGRLPVRGARGEPLQLLTILGMDEVVDLRAS